MEPKILDGMWCLFHPNVVGTRQHRIVGGEILLLPLNPEFFAIRLENDGIYRISGWFVGATSRIRREAPSYRLPVGLGGRERCPGGRVAGGGTPGQGVVC
jgi:hypothetical protein